MHQKSRLILLLFLSTSTFGFVENIRHGYGNCITCHVSPSGGGVLTRYGRELSKEVQSTWGVRREIRAGYGLIPLPDWLTYGGDIRLMQIYRNTPTVEEGNFFPMQLDFEVAAKVKRFIIDATFGAEEKKPKPSANLTPAQSKKRETSFVSRRHYLNYRPWDFLSFRGGKFLSAYGLNTPNHVLQIKRGLGFDEGNETYNLEAAYIGENYNGYVTGIFGRPDDKSLAKESGISTSHWYYFNERYKVGVSFYQGKNKFQKHQAYGPSAVLGFTEKLVLLAEIDFQKLDPVLDPNSSFQGVGAKGYATYEKLSYEIFQGMHLFGMHEFSQLDKEHGISIIQNFGLGFNFFPRPKWEFEAAYQKRLLKATFNKYTDFAYFLIHFYL